MLILNIFFFILKGTGIHTEIVNIKVINQIKLHTKIFHLYLCKIKKNFKEYKYYCFIYSKHFIEIIYLLFLNHSNNKEKEVRFIFSLLARMRVKPISLIL